MPQWPDARARKFRQAAIFYVLVAVVYEGAVFLAWRGGFAPRAPESRTASAAAGQSSARA